MGDLGGPILDMAEVTSTWQQHNSPAPAPARYPYHIGFHATVSQRWVQSDAALSPLSLPSAVKNARTISRMCSYPFSAPGAGTTWSA